MRTRHNHGPRKDKGTAGHALKANNDHILDESERLEKLIGLIEVRMEPYIAQAFRAYFSEKKMAELRRGYAGVRVTNFAHGELAATINIGLRLLGFESYAEFFKAIQPAGTVNVS